MNAWESDDLFFGMMYEDAGVELAEMVGRRRVLAVASAGCTAFALAAAGHEVTAVDVSPAQVEYVRHRLAGGRPRPGKAEQWLARGRAVVEALVWRRGEAARFTAMANPEAQREFWCRRVVPPAVRGLLGLALSAPLLTALYGRRRASAVPRPFAASVLSRLERGLARHPNRDNPYLRRLLLGELPPPLTAAERAAIAPRLRVRRADAAAYLEAAAPGSFDAFALSNLLDGAPRSDARRLWRAVARAAAPGAVAVLRSFAEPRGRDEERRAANDRSLLWGRVTVVHFGAVAGTAGRET